ncbi:hypothetical protein M011DRAFT_460711 [Sporormia fimetaria CBS 119925]|uniref:Uncharacterized protein n=1 Tax=Sporormia fimetaria CBS 119925 TaxID=1340428 RepID=A0A6A6V4N3_9PLEO|nr:hypothetical protein M011DRAFT_460711 [Sporormia fimetaria CBS 119925]
MPTQKVVSTHRRRKKAKAKQETAYDSKKKKVVAQKRPRQQPTPASEEPERPDQNHLEQGEEQGWSGRVTDTRQALPNPRPKIALRFKVPKGCGWTGHGMATTRAGRVVKKTKKMKAAVREMLDSSPPPDNQHGADGSVHDSISPPAPINNATPGRRDLAKTFYTPPHSPPDFLSTIDPEIHTHLANLLAFPDIPIKLPTLRTPHTNPSLAIHSEYDTIHPWTSRQLFHLYLLAYSQSHHHICDLIVDTWILAFHVVEASANSSKWIPLRNPRPSAQYIRPPPSPSALRNLPKLDGLVTGFDPVRLNELYAHTRADCGARMLWADAMALSGKWLERRLNKKGSMMKDWNAELVWDVMMTGLRGWRQRLTLGVEEGDKGREKWCKRYHEHVRVGGECYWVLKEKGKGKEGEGEEC